MLNLVRFDNLIAFLTLTSVERVLGIDNVIVIAIVVSRLQAEPCGFARKCGLMPAMLIR